MNKVLYFAYGSNISPERLEWRVDKCECLGRYKLYGYALKFTGGFHNYANIEPSRKATDFVDGILWDLDEFQIKKLDMFEGHPATYQKFFKIDGDRIIFGYWDLNPTSEGFPPRDYMEKILDGARHFGMVKLQKQMEDMLEKAPPEIITFIQQFNTSTHGKKGRSNKRKH